MKLTRRLEIKYSFVDYEQSEHQKRLDDAFDVLFDEIENDNLERIDSKNEYEHSTIIK